MERASFDDFSRLQDSKLDRSLCKHFLDLVNKCVQRVPKRRPPIGNVRNLVVLSTNFRFVMIGKNSRKPRTTSQQLKKHVYLVKKEHRNFMAYVPIHMCDCIFITAQ